MHIAFFVNAFPVPSETFILSQITGLLDRGHRVDIYANALVTPLEPDSKVAEYDLMGRTTHFDVPASLPIRLLRAIQSLVSNKRKCRLTSAVQTLNFLRYGRVSLSLRLFYSALKLPGRVKYDIIHSQFGSLGPIALCLRDSGAISGKLVTSFRGYDIAALTERKSGIYGKLFREGDLFLPVSRHFAQILLDHGCDERKIMVHHSGVDCDAFSYRDRTRLEVEPTKLITIGRLVEKKGIAYAVRAVARLIEGGRQVMYTVVGDGEIRTELEKLVAGPRLDPYVRLVGWKNQDEVIRFVEDAHVLVAPTLYEPGLPAFNIPAFQNIQALGANWVNLTPSWTYSNSNPLIFSEIPGKDAFWTDTITSVSQARALNLNVAIFPQARFATNAGDFWKNAPRDSGWWGNWFDHYRAYPVHFADMATLSGAQGLILGGDWITPALPSGKLADGNPSGVPADAEARWKNIIAEVRQHFRGNVLFALPYTNVDITPPINVLKGDITGAATFP